MTSEDPSKLLEKVGKGDLPSNAVVPIAHEATEQTLRMAGGPPIVFNASNNHNVTINIINQNIQVSNFVTIVQQMAEFQALPEERKEPVLEKVQELQEAVAKNEPGFVKSCIKHLWDEGKDFAASVLAKLLTQGMTGP